MPSGNDSYGHVAIGEYYAKNIFPSTWGWTQKWFDGMPFPQFYPPMFYFVAAFVYMLLPLSYAAVFKLCILVSTLAIPGLLGFILYKYTKNIWAASSTVATAAVLLSMFYPKYGNMGVTLQGTFHVGLAPHLFGFICLIIWLYFFLNATKSIRDYYLSIVALFFTLLASVHVLPVALVVYIVQFVALERRAFTHPKKWLQDPHLTKRLVRFFALGALPLGASLFWYLPMLAYFGNMAGRSLGIDTGPGASGIGLFLLRWSHLVVFTVGAGLLAYRKRHMPILVLSISSLLLFIPVAFHVERLFPRFPIHIYRALPCFYMLSAICVGYCLYRIIFYLPSIFYKVFFTLIFSTPFILAWVPIMNSNKISDFYFGYNRDRAEDIADYLKDKKGTFNVEVTSGARALEYVISRKAGDSMKSTYNILVESAIQSPFMVPVRGAYSTRDERMSVDAYLRSNSVFRNQGFDKDAVRAQILGINFFIVSSGQMKAQMEKDPHMELEKDFGHWRIYHLKDPVRKEVHALEYEPTIVFAPADFKKRTTTTFDFVRFQEELFLRADPTMVLARGEDQYLDTTPDLDRFKSAIIVDYTYKNYDKALARITEFAKTHPLVLIQDKSELFVGLEKKLRGSKNVRFVAEQITRDGDQKVIRTAMGFIFEFLKETQQPIKNIPTIDSYLITDSKIEVKFASSTPQAVPVLITSTYFPAWKRTDGESTYMASPVYTLTYIKDSATITFAKPLSLIIGYILSLLALGAAVYSLRRDLKK